MRRRFSCGHRGLGKYCHRCDFAEKLENLVKEGKSYTDHKDHPKPHVWSKEEMVAEANRLRQSQKM